MNRNSQNDWEVFSCKMSDLSQKIQNIANRTARMAIVGTANPSNDEFCELMKALENLYIMSEELIRNYEVIDPK